MTKRVTYRMSLILVLGFMLVGLHAQTSDPKRSAYQPITMDQEMSALEEALEGATYQKLYSPIVYLDKASLANEGEKMVAGNRESGAYHIVNLLTEESRVLFQNRKYIKEMALSSLGDKVAFVEEDRTEGTLLKLYTVANRREITLLNISEYKAVDRLSFSPDGRYLAAQIHVKWDSPRRILSVIPLDSPDNPMTLSPSEPVWLLGHAWRHRDLIVSVNEGPNINKFGIVRLNTGSLTLAFEEDFKALNDFFAGMYRIYSTPGMFMSWNDETGKLAFTAGFRQSRDSQVQRGVFIYDPSLGSIKHVVDLISQLEWKDSDSVIVMGYERHTRCQPYEIRIH